MYTHDVFRKALFSVEFFVAFACKETALAFRKEPKLCCSGISLYDKFTIRKSKNLRSFPSIASAMVEDDRVSRAQMAFASAK